MFFVKYLLLIGLLILPMFFWEVPKVWIYLVFIQIFIATFLYYFVKSKLKLNSNDKNIKYSIYIFLITVILASIFGVDFSKSVVGNFYRMDGLITLILLSGFSIVFSYVYKNNWKNSLAIAIFVSSVISCIWNNFGQINFLVGFILISIPFGIYLFNLVIYKTSKLLIILGFLLEFRMIILAHSYVGILGFILLLPLWFLINNLKYIKYLILPIILICFGVILFWYKNLNKNNEFVAESRVRIYRNIFLGSLKKPILGYGWANTDYAFESIIWPMKFNNDVYVDKAHMLLLDIFSNSGLVGLITYSYFIYLLFRKLFKKNDLWSKTLILALLMHFLYSQTNVTSISEEFIFWIIVGITLSL